MAQLHWLPTLTSGPGILAAIASTPRTPDDSEILGRIGSLEIAAQSAYGMALTTYASLIPTTPAMLLRYLREAQSLHSTRQEAIQGQAGQKAPRKADSTMQRLVTVGLAGATGPADLFSILAELEANLAATMATAVALLAGANDCELIGSMLPGAGQLTSVMTTLSRALSAGLIQVISSPSRVAELVDPIVAAALGDPFLNLAGAQPLTGSQ